jgi:hypothetical protein
MPGAEKIDRKVLEKKTFSFSFLTNHLFLTTATDTILAGYSSCMTPEG